MIGSAARRLLLAAGCSVVLAGSGCGRRFLGQIPDDAATLSSDAAMSPDAPTERPADAGAPDAGAPDADANVGSLDGGGDDATDAAPDAAADTAPDDAADAAPATDAAPDASNVDADADADAEPATPALGVLAGRVRMTGSLPDGTKVNGAGAAGVVVTLSGPVARTAITDANGSYRFTDIAAGAYTMRIDKQGAAFAETEASGVRVEAGGGGTTLEWSCAYPCGDGPEIDARRELFIQDDSVRGDARASNAAGGPWSFRYLMEQISSGMTPNAFADLWITNLANSGRDVSKLRLVWPTVVEGAVSLPDLARAPFQLLAIVNRIDLHTSGAGELGFIFGIYNPPGSLIVFNMQGATFTVMLSYRLPLNMSLRTRSAWAARFHELGQIPFGDAYNAKLAELTELVVRGGALPSLPDNPKGSALASLRTSEQFATGDTHQLREFRMLPDPSNGRVDLVVAPTPQTPDWSLNAMDGPLPAFLNANAALVKAGFAVLPAELLGNHSVAPWEGRWSFPSVTDESLRHAFAGQTCSGCHTSEFWMDGLTPPRFHVHPIYPGPNNRSYWIDTVELPRRAVFMRHLLTCSGAACAVGGAAMM